MISPIENGTTALLSLAIDAATMRQAAIAQNIANATTPGYQPVSVSFEERMGALRAGVGQGRAPSLAELSHYRPLLESADAGTAVAVDAEVAKLSETVVHHQALLKALNKHFALLGMAINEGKR
jgi:flagellar basal-body rod protein FlgB